MQMQIEAELSIVLVRSEPPAADHAVLRPWRALDIDSLVHVVDDYEIQRRTFAPAPTEQAVSQWIGRTVELGAEGKAALFAVTDRNNGAILGNAGLTRISWYSLVADLDCWIGARFRGQGLGCEVIRAISIWGFQALGLQRIQGFVHSDNIASRRLVESAGYRLEGILRSAALVEGSRRDLALYALLASDNR